MNRSDSDLQDRPPVAMGMDSVLHGDPANCASTGPAEELQVHDVLSGLFGLPVPLSPWRSASGLRMVTRWRHRERRGRLPAMHEHMVGITHAGSGMVILSRDGKRSAGQLRRGAVTILPAGPGGEVDFTGERECSQVIVPQAALRTAARDCGLTDASLVERLTIIDPTLFNLVDMLTAEGGNDASGQRFREQCAVLLCTHLVRRHSREAPAEVEPTVPGLAAWQLRRIHDFMVGHLHAPLTLESIASQVALSRHYVCTAFRQSTGFTPHEYLTSLRIERAKALLLSSDLPISEIAAAVGYCTASAFTASFRRCTGMTPSHLRAGR